MPQDEYEIKIVKILDATFVEELIDEESDRPKYTCGLTLLLQEVKTDIIFQTHLDSEEVRKIINSPDPLGSKNLIDLSIYLRSREEPVRLMIPKSAQDIKAQDIIDSRKLDDPNFGKPAPQKTSPSPKRKKNRKYYKRYNQNNHQNKKNNVN